MARARLMQFSFLPNQSSTSPPTCPRPRHVSEILSDEMTGGKVLVFAHHRNVLDALEQGVLKTSRVEYIRIDGRTKVDTIDVRGTFITLHSAVLY